MCVRAGVESWWVWPTCRCPHLVKGEKGVGDGGWIRDERGLVVTEERVHTNRVDSEDVYRQPIEKVIKHILGQQVCTLQRFLA